MLGVRISEAPASELLGAPDTLAVVDFDAAPTARPDDARHIVTPLGSPSPLREVWTTSTEVIGSGGVGPIQFASTMTETIGSLVLRDEGTDMEALAYNAYSTLLGWLAAQRHRHLWRIWNYFPGIIDGPGDEERYRRFSVGRQRALRESAFPDQALPPATAIGCQADQLFLMFIASDTPCVPVENPRQISAYRYPREYGPASPSFSRAARVSMHPRPGALIVSGTASIVGHETQHPNNWQAQLEEINRNLASLARRAGAHPEPNHIRLYARPDVPMPALLDAVHQRWPRTPVVPLTGEICRQDLLLEIEGLWSIREPADDHAERREHPAAGSSPV